MDYQENKGLFCEVGFNAENAILELTRLKEGKTPNLYALSKNQEVVNLYSEILSENQKVEKYIPFLIKEIESRKKHSNEKAFLKELIFAAKKTKSVLERALENENVPETEIKEGIKFFDGLKKRCIEYISEVSYS